MPGASPSSNPFIAIYGRNSCTKETPLVTNSAERGRYFKSGAADKFLLEVRAGRLDSTRLPFE